MGHLRPSGLQSVLYMLVAEGEKVDMTHGVNSMLPPKKKNSNNNKTTNKQKMQTFFQLKSILWRGF